MCQKFADTLSANSQTLDDSEVISYLLTGLPFAYDLLVISITTRVESMSLNDRYGFFLSHELLLKQHASLQELGLTIANLATNNFSSQGRGNS